MLIVWCAQDDIFHMVETIWLGLLMAVRVLIDMYKSEYGEEDIWVCYDFDDYVEELR